MNKIFKIFREHESSVKVAWKLGMVVHTVIPTPWVGKLRQRIESSRPVWSTQ
jgi:hypothetical protein